MAKTPSFASAIYLRGSSIQMLTFDWAAHGRVNYLLSTYSRVLVNYLLLPTCSHNNGKPRFARNISNAVIYKLLP